MFSLRKQISHLDDLAETYKFLIESLGAVMDSVTNHLPDSPKQSLDQLKTIRAGVAPTLDKDGIADTRNRFNTAIEVYGKNLTGHIRRQERETMEILDLLSSVADQFAKRDHHHGGRMQSIARKLRSLTTVTSLSEIKSQLTQEVEQLEKAMEEMTRTNAAVLSRLQESLVELRPTAPSFQEAGSPRFAVRGPVVHRRPGRHCLALFIVERPSRRVSDILAGFLDLQDRLDLPNSSGLTASEFGITKECSLPDMIAVMEAACAELQQAGFECRGGAAERLRGEESIEFIRRARGSASSL